MNTWLNYHHLYYFWVITEEGSLSKAASRLRLTQPTLSVQLRQLESALSLSLFRREGKRLSLTPDGQFVLHYAKQIFQLGSELQHAARHGGSARAAPLRIGISDSLPKLVAHRAIAPVLTLGLLGMLHCTEGKRLDLSARLMAHELDLVLSDAPLVSETAVPILTYQLDVSPVALFGVPKLARKFRRWSIAQSNHLGPLVLPTRETMLRRSLDAWFEQHGIVPEIVGEFEDSALMKTFGAQGFGLFPVPTVVAQEVKTSYGAIQAIELAGVTETFYATTIARQISHPGITAITERGRSIH